MTAEQWQDTAPLTHGDVVVLDYLAALWAVSEDLSPDLRDELMAAVTEYVALRRTAASDPIADPEQIVGRLGPPEALVAAARRGHFPPHLRRPVRPEPPPPAPAATDTGPSEYIALALLTGGAVIVPVAGPIAGMLLASGSPRWTAAQKAMAWVLTAGSAGLSAILLMLAAISGLTEITLFLAFAVMVAGPMAAAFCLKSGSTPRGAIGHRPY
jgi:hypothetical protein